MDLATKETGLKKKVTLPCSGTKEKRHYEAKGKLYGVYPVAHCDTNCPYKNGSCIENCSRVPIKKRPCLQEDYSEEEE
jgi:hypothetical protein